MIWATAKSTDVNRCHRPYPEAGEGCSGRTVGCWPPRRRPGSRWLRLLDGAERRDGPPVERPSRPERVREVGLEVLEVLEPDRDAQQAGRDPGGQQLRLARLAVRGRRRVDDHRVDAAERRGQLGERQRVDDRPAGGAAAGRPRRRASRRRTPGRNWRSATSCWGWLSQDRDTGRATRRPDARATPPVPRRSRRAARPGRRGSGCPRRTRKASSGPSVAPVSIWTRSTARDVRRGPGDDAGDDVAVAAEELGRRLDDEVRARARAAGRRTARRRCCRRRTSRRADGRGRPARRGRRRGRRVGDGLRVEDAASAPRRAPRPPRRGRSCRRCRPGPRSPPNVRSICARVEP